MEAPLIKKVRVRHIPTNASGYDGNGVYHGHSGFKEVYSLDPDWGNSYSRIVFARQEREAFRMARRIWWGAEVIRG